MDRKSCCWCKHYFEDMSVNATDCLAADEMTEDDFEKYFVEENIGCPCFVSCETC